MQSDPTFATTAPLRWLDLVNIALWSVACGLALPIIAFMGPLTASRIASMATPCLCGAASLWLWTRLANAMLPRAIPGRTVWLLLALVLGSIVVTLVATRSTFLPMPVAVVRQDGIRVEIPAYILFLRNWALVGPTHLVYGGVAAALIARSALEARERALAAARHEAQTVQLAALRAQVNPHFLFNTLNTATALIELQRPADARLLLLRLGDYFRTSLESPPAAFSRLEEEFDSLDAYLQIEMARYGDKLRLEMDLPDPLRGARIPTMLLQPLVENAVRHGAAQASGDVTITLSATRSDSRLTIFVEDDAAASIARPSAKPGAGIGLANVRARLAAHYGAEGALTIGAEGTIFRATVNLPLVFGETALARADR